MGRFSPTIVPTWGQQFGQALQGGVGTFLQMRRQKLEDEKDMYGHGLQAVDPNAPTPAPAPGAGFQPGTVAQTNASIVRGVQPMTPAPSSGDVDLGAPSASPAPYTGANAMAVALARHVQSGQPLQSPRAAAPQPAPEQVGAALDPYSQPVHLMGRDWVMTPQARAQMAIANALRQAQIGRENAGAAKDWHESVKLQPGDPGYEESLGRIAGLEAGAKYPYENALEGTRGNIALRNALTVGRQRGDIEAGLQTGSQTFQQGQQTREHTFQTQQIPIRNQAEQDRQLAILAEQRRYQIIPSLVSELRDEMGSGPTPAAPRRAPLPGTVPKVGADNPFGDLVPPRKK